MVQVYSIIDGFEEKWWGPYTDKKLAEKVLKIVQMAVDDGAEILTIEANQHAEQLNAGLLPFKIEVLKSVATGEVLGKPEVALTWPPHEAEGIREEREDYILYFFWAKSPAEAIRKLSTVKRSSSAQAPKARAATW